MDNKCADLELLLQNEDILFAIGCNLFVEDRRDTSEVEQLRREHPVMMSLLYPPIRCNRSYSRLFDMSSLIALSLVNKQVHSILNSCEILWRRYLRGVGVNIPSPSMIGSKTTAYSLSKIYHPLLHDFLYGLLTFNPGEIRRNGRLVIGGMSTLRYAN